MKGIFLNGTRCFISHIELQALPMPWLQTQTSLRCLLNLESSMCVLQHGSGSKGLKEDNHLKSYEASNQLLIKNILIDFERRFCKSMYACTFRVVFAYF